MNYELILKALRSIMMKEPDKTTNDLYLLAKLDKAITELEKENDEIRQRPKS